ncbi:MAG: hypothetical protein HOC20_13950 [Chloroflexi bacterium]|jgi:hypothetical protein|nr:hypothetical protein [Chloroflexota bacterium]
MARYRMIKPDFWADEKLAMGCSRDARLLFIATWNLSDDYGVVKGSPLWLKGNALPYDDVTLEDFTDWLTALEEIGVLVPFLHSGEKYYHIPNFSKHQSINRPSKQRNPAFLQTLSEGSVRAPGVLTDEVEV